MRAKNASLRARISLHSDVEHPVQEMVIAFYKDTTLDLIDNSTSESFHVMEGEIDVIFDEVGKLLIEKDWAVQKLLSKFIQVVRRNGTPLWWPPNTPLFMRSRRVV